MISETTRAYVGKTCPSGLRNYKCQCSCGSVFTTVRPWQTGSCGCIAKETAARISRTTRRLPYGESGRRQVLADYRRGAKVRGFDWQLTDARFFELAAFNCAYCGDPPDNIWGRKTAHGIFIYSGVDRKNASLGYSRDNCVPCCRLCNIMKRDKTVTDFIAHAKRIIAHRASSCYGPVLQ